MPRGDKTGPVGGGAMTGRKAGFCAGHDLPGYMNPAGDRGGYACRGFLGRGRGGGRNRRRWYHEAGPSGWLRGRGWQGDGSPATGPMTSDQEIEALEQQTAVLEQSLADVKERLGSLKKELRNER